MPNVTSLFLGIIKILKAEIVYLLYIIYLLYNYVLMYLLYHDYNWAIKEDTKSNLISEIVYFDTIVIMEGKSFP